ncbi:hypothetical protein HWC80_gp087 [Mycobacterium phage Indlulamithi]|uniref:Uncharacterized protein n=1 Tax=Mycobacterium phage Indlulamithi TaxID=2656582 RepID=A0A649VDH0_9CAUD|nr:hypothetical protein HWC80_gp087 [Mycobacterium phage Indlulamithi]QGJ90125.1 hypothetical protein PBI_INDLULAMITHI_87 [Mycobacterium phage Indlulamithi]
MSVLEGPTFKAKYGGVCNQCGFSYEKGEAVHYVKDRVAHEHCHANTQFDNYPAVDDEDRRIHRSVANSEGYVARGIRKPKLCKECHIEHAGECW